MYCGGHGYTLPCPQCAANLARRLAKARPPSDRGQGRKPLSSAEKTVSKTFRLTEAQAAKVERLGGAQWVRDRIEKAKEQK
jgi:hypothetical protein